MKTFLDFNPKCPCCNNEMILEDVDYNFPGNQNEYWRCSNNECNTNCVIKIRYEKICHKPIKYFDSQRELTYMDFIYPTNLIR